MSAKYKKLVELCIVYEKKLISFLFGEKDTTSASAYYLACAGLPFRHRVVFGKIEEAIKSGPSALDLSSSIFDDVREEISIMMQDTNNKVHNISRTISDLRETYKSILVYETLGSVDNYVDEDGNINEDDIVSACCAVISILSKDDCKVVDRNNLKDKLPKLAQVRASIKTGYRNLDQHLGSCFRLGNTIVIASRPGVGKTTFALNIINNLIEPFIESKSEVLFFSLDMDIISLYNRITAVAYNIPEGYVLDLPIDEILNRVKHIPIIVSSEHELYDIKRVILNYKNTVKVVVVDYIQIVRGVPGASRSEQIGSFVAAIKKVCSEFGIMLILLSQLNRQSSLMPGNLGEIAMHCLKDSGQIEQDADAILALEKDVSKDYHGINVWLCKNRYSFLEPGSYISFEQVGSNYYEQCYCVEEPRSSQKKNTGPQNREQNS